MAATPPAIDEAAVVAAQTAVPSDDLLRRVVELFQALADPTRARVLYALAHGPLCVRDLALVAGVSQSAMSHQLRLLRDRRLVRSRRAGTVIYYALDDDHVEALLRQAEDHAGHGDPPLPRSLQP